MDDFMDVVSSSDDVKPSTSSYYSESDEEDDQVTSASLIEERERLIITNRRIMTYGELENQRNENRRKRLPQAEVPVVEPPISPPAPVNEETLVTSATDIEYSEQPIDIAATHKCEYDYCNASFTCLTELLKLQKMRFGENPYKCDFVGCTEAFTLYSELFVHKQMTHPNLYGPGSNSAFKNPKRQKTNNGDQ